MVTEAKPELVGRRYRILELIGHGGMGSVYRAQDRLGGVVALKRLRHSVTDMQQDVTTRAGGGILPEEMALALAHEFRTLASLRHPNIISVLDYGFDVFQQPYLAMDLLERPRTIVSAGDKQPLAVQIDLLVQMLRALAYLHRWGIIHRDLKPANVLVVDQLVKVLDFGIASSRDRGSWVQGTAGTLGYLAPEVLCGEPATERADLYAVGVIAHEVFCGYPPFQTDGTGISATVPVQIQRSTQALGAPLVLPGHLPPRLGQWLERLLATEPADRFPSAEEAIVALCRLSEQPVPAETAASRESFLQAARFVGRAREREQFAELITQGLAGRGSAWLVSGESGVGKSRLLDEVRALALVRGAAVLRGQAVGEGGSPYLMWRPVLRWLALLSDLQESEASILKPLVPDIETLIGRPVPDPIDIDAEVAQARLFSLVEDVLARQRQLVLIIIDDLQWADRESIKLLARLSALAPRAPLLLLGSYRDDERPGLPAELPAMQVLKLQRLSAEEIADLTQSMLGHQGRRPEVVELLQRETEGNPFFLVEVVRAMAETGGRLETASQAAVQSIHGVHEVVRRRLERVPPAARPLLDMAAVIGRQVDLALLRVLAPAVDLESWLMTCAAAAVLEVGDGEWRFAHHKLRQGVLGHIEPLSRPGLHRRVAQAIEKVYGDAEDKTAALAYHWGEAGERDKEAHYAQRAGEQALRVGACQAASSYLGRALELVSTMPEETGAGDEPAARAPAQGRFVPMLGQKLGGALGAVLGLDSRVQRHDRRFRLGHLEALLAETHFQLGDMAACRGHAERALRHFGRPMPRTMAGWVGGTLRQVATRVLQELRPSSFVETSPEYRQVLTEASHLQSRLTDAFIYTQEALPMLWSGLRMLNLCEPAGPSPDLARGYTVMAVTAGTIPIHWVAEAWSQRALSVVESTGNAADIAYVLCRNGVYATYLARWQAVETWMKRAIAIVDDVGDFRLAEECRSLLSLVQIYQGKFEACLPLAAWIENSARRRGSVQTQHWGPLQQAAALVRLGRPQAAITALEPVLPWMDQHGGSAEAILAYGPLALAHLRRGDRESARRAANRVLEIIRTTKPIAHWNQIGLGATAEVFLHLWETAATTAERESMAAAARQTVEGQRAFARVFPFGQPFALLWQGSEEWLSGRRDAALITWQRAITEAERLTMPYEEARARLELGRRLAPDDMARKNHLNRACELLAELKAADDLAVARAIIRR
ncbi:MAG TPA: AAA family ATPase [Polyangia bacterium]|nr:AAA family ATPase [Polyangia bacterium]